MVQGACNDDYLAQRGCTAFDRKRAARKLSGKATDGPIRNLADAKSVNKPRPLPESGALPAKAALHSKNRNHI
ncbi:hypothetical protein SPHINGOR109_10140 [Sphingorhabdus sp. 109]|nr:hypothetical protein SPHINGOR109_10140 [Sphingorhabdus sp. 109]